MTKKTDITKKDSKALATLIKEKREELRQERFSLAGSRVRDVKKMRTAKKDIARALTALRNQD